LRLFFLCRIKVLADVADGCDVSDAAADCSDGFTDGFNRSSGNLLNRRGYIWQRGLW
jgi:hypothetical protein